MTGQHLDDEIRISPDGRHTATLIDARLDPRYTEPYFAIAIDGQRIDDLIVRHNTVWSRDSRFLMAQNVVFDADGYELKIIDPDQLRYANIPIAAEPQNHFGFDGTADAFQAYCRGDVARASIDLAELDWQPLRFVTKPPASPVYKPPTGPLDDARLNRLAAALPLLEEASERLAASGRDVTGGAQFRADIQDHYDDRARGATPANPITFERLDCLSAYPYRLAPDLPADPLTPLREGRLSPAAILATELRELIWSLDLLGRQGNRTYAQQIEEQRLNREREAQAESAPAPPPKPPQP